MKGSTVSPMLLRLSPKDGVDECAMGRGECSMSLSGTPSTESREFNAQWLPSPFRERRDSEGCRPAKMRLALRVTPSSMDGPLFICADTRAAFRRCRSAISHRFKVCRKCDINAQGESEALKYVPLLPVASGRQFLQTRTCPRAHPGRWLCGRRRHLPCSLCQRVVFLCLCLYWSWTNVVELQTGPHAIYSPSKLATGVGKAQVAVPWNVVRLSWTTTTTKLMDAF